MNNSIKRILDNVMERAVQKKLSWSGKGTSKPSIIKEYKEIIDAMKEVLHNSYKGGYNFDELKRKVSTILQNA